MWGLYIISGDGIMSVYDDFDRILANFNRVEERVFLGEIQDFAEQNPEVVNKTFALLLKNQGLNIQLKYLVLKSIGQLKNPDMVPILKEAMKNEDKVQLMAEAVNSLAAIGTLHAYKVIVDFLLKHKESEGAEKIEHTLRTFFIRNQMAYHFDIFYRDRGDVNNIEKSCDFLIKHLPDEYIKDILSAVGSKYAKIRFEMLRLLKNRPNSIYYSTIYNVFKENLHTAEEELFLLMSEALIINASLSIAKQKIFQKLKVHLGQLKGEKLYIFCIVLLKLSAREIIPYIVKIYPRLGFDRKMLLFEYLNPGDYVYFINFVRGLLDTENNQHILAKIVDIFIQARDFKFLFETLDREKGLRKQKLLELILEHDPEGIDNHLQKYLDPSQDNEILYSTLGYLLRHAADTYFEPIKSIFFSGVAHKVKILILRSVNKFDPLNQKFFMESIFKDLVVIRDFRKDFLFSLLGVMNDKVFEEELEEKVLGLVLVLLEEASESEIINFIYFFDKYEIKSRKDSELISDELRLIQNTLLKSSSDQNLVRMIHVLIKNIERKMTLKKKDVPPASTAP